MIHKCTCLKDSKSLGALGASLQEGVLPTKRRTGAAPAMNSKQHCFEKVRAGSCVQLWSPGEAPYAVRFLLSAVRQRLLGLCTGCRARGWDSPCSQLCTNTRAFFHKSDFQQHCSCSNCQVCNEATHTKAFWCTCGFSQVSPCWTDSLDSQTSHQDSTGEPGTEKRHISPYISATAEVIREILVKET